MTIADVVVVVVVRLFTHSVPGTIVVVVVVVVFFCGVYGGEREDSARVSLRVPRDESQTEDILRATRRTRSGGGDRGSGRSEPQDLIIVVA